MAFFSRDWIGRNQPFPFGQNRSLRQNMEQMLQSGYFQGNLRNGHTQPILSLKASGNRPELEQILRGDMQAFSIPAQRENRPFG